jgi:tetraacyldisaccharide 4'-kinase
LREDLKPYVKNLTPLRFPDHHEFNDDDVQLINETFANMPSPKIVISTEKDAVRINDTKGLSKEIKDNIYSLPVKIKFLLEQEEVFNEKIISYVRKNSRNSILAKTKDDNKSKDSHNSGNGSRTISF